MKDNNQKSTSEAIHGVESWSGPHKLSGLSWLFVAGYLAYQLHFGGAGGDITMNVVVWIAIVSSALAGILSLIYLKW